MSGKQRIAGRYAQMTAAGIVSGVMVALVAMLHLGTALRGRVGHGGGVDRGVVVVAVMGCRLCRTTVPQPDFRESRYRAAVPEV